MRVFFVAATLLICTLIASSARSDDAKVCSMAVGAIDANSQIEACTRALADEGMSSQNRAITYYNRGVVWQTKGDHDKAIADYDSAIRLNPKHANAYAGRCWARGVMGRELPLALRDCNQSLQLHPNFAFVLNNRGLVHLKLSAYDDAIDDYTAAVTLNPKDADSLFKRGTAKRQKGDRTAGGADMAAAKAIDPEIAAKFDLHLRGVALAPPQDAKAKVKP